MALTKVRAVLVVLVVLGLAAACGPETPAEQADPTSTPSSTPTPTPARTAADGTDLTACADGTCEVSVEVGQEISMPAETTMKSLKVTKIAGDRVELAGRGEGGGMGGCYGQPPCDFSNNGGAITMTLGTSSTAVNNGYGLTVVSIGDDTAIISVEPAG